ncbi:MAG: DNA-3-methyladenine glycosylase I [Granulosicoccus sp.]
MPEIKECPVPHGDPIFKRYHDCEWGMPVTSDTRIFEKVCLEGFQAGLSWQTILKRREHFRLAFASFDIVKVAKFTDNDEKNLLQNKNIIRNKKKIRSAVNNARRALELQSEYGSLGSFFWSFEPKSDNRPNQISREWLAANPTSTESIQLSKALKKRGWSFVGPTTMYALMQALGLVNDHVQCCPARGRVERAREQLIRPVIKYDANH